MVAQRVLTQQLTIQRATPDDDSDVVGELIANPDVALFHVRRSCQLLRKSPGQLPAVRDPSPHRRAKQPRRSPRASEIGGTIAGDGCAGSPRRQNEAPMSSPWKPLDMKVIEQALAAMKAFDPNVIQQALAAA